MNPAQNHDGAPVSKLTFAELRKANSLRLPQFKNAEGGLAHSEPDGSDWTPADWMVAVVGEVGEAANIMKKIRRGDFGEVGSVSYCSAINRLEKEFADIVTYMDLMAYQFRVDLGRAIEMKFNEVSGRVNSTICLVNGKQRIVGEEY
jgi:NTP pyrophosphatase (non-canonical NTP hydrolase)